MKSDQQQLMEAVKELRTGLGLTQTQLGHRIGKSLAAVLRYETLRAPKGKVLHQLYRLAESEGYPMLALTFRSALNEELGGGLLPREARTFTPVPEEDGLVLHLMFVEPDALREERRTWDQLSERIKSAVRTVARDHSITVDECVLTLRLYFSGLSPENIPSQHDGTSVIKQFCELTGIADDDKKIEALLEAKDKQRPNH